MVSKNDFTVQQQLSHFCLVFFSRIFIKTKLRQCWFINETSDPWAIKRSWVTTCWRWSDFLFCWFYVLKHLMGKTALLHLVTLRRALVFLGISGQKVVVRIEILPGRLGSCSPILNFPCLCAILIVCHFCLQTRLWSAKIRPMETWGGAVASLSSRDRFPALASLHRVCVSFLIKVALVSPSLCFVWIPS